MKLTSKATVASVLILLLFYINWGSAYFLKDSFEETEVVDNETWIFNLGSSTGTFNLEFNITSERSIDILFLDDENYYDYDFGQDFSFPDFLVDARSSSAAI